MAPGPQTQDAGARTAQSGSIVKTSNSKEGSTVGHAISGLLWTLVLTLLVFGVPVLAGIDTSPKDLP